MSKAPLISVVVPTCDKPDQLALCLEALKPGKQRLMASSYEVIVSDDGPDQLARRVVEVSFPWARWVAGARRGPAANRNTGAAAARGTLLAFTDDDCVPSLDWLAAFAAAHRLHPESAFEGRTRAQAPFTSVWHEAPANESGGYFWSCNIALPRDVFERVGRFDEAYRHPNMEDVDLRSALELHRVGVLFVPAAEVAHPIRTVSPAAKLRSVQRLEAQVYYARKWSGATAPAVLRTLVVLVTQHFLLRPARFRSWDGLGMMVMYPAFLARALYSLPSWYRRAGEILKGRDRPNGKTQALPGASGHGIAGTVELTQHDLDHPA